jgi:hypothetical protein
MTTQRRGIACKEQRRLEAKERNTAWQALSPREQLDSLDKRRMSAVKQRARITRLVQS